MAKFSGNSSTISFDDIGAREHIMQSSYLSLLCEYLYMVEIYSHHTFSHQFGFSILGQHSERLPTAVLYSLYQLYHSCTRTSTKSKVLVPAISCNFGDCFTRLYSTWWIQLPNDYFKNGPKTLIELFFSSMNDPVIGTTLGSKADAEIIAMDEGISSQKRHVPQEVKDETPTGDHLSAYLSQ
ncbi:hypothetical protein ACH5RR_032482 [Cinchona calisaya]|uniref:Uncharacterized protein n=1 Tax=Cinchona calisaya TaxID=153742 RepID=A0ABD2YMF2_9GENT